MNELSNQLKNLSYCLTVLPVSNKCVEAIACRHDLKKALITLSKALAKHRHSGFDLEGKKLPIEHAFLSALDKIQSNHFTINEVHKQCNLLTQLEKSALLDLTQKVIDKMDERAAKAQRILSAMQEHGLQIKDIKPN